MNARIEQLAVAITTMNNIRTIERTLDSVRDLADAIVVVDSGSTDGTLDRCQASEARIVHRAWNGPTQQKQFAMDQCADHSWVLLLDSDESLEPELQDSVRAAIREDDETIDGWSFRRKIWFMGGWLHHTFQPEWRLRLVRSGAYRVVGIGPEGRGGHDRVEVQGRTGRLEGICRHDSWADLHEWSRRNIDLAARAAMYAGGGGRPINLLVNPPAAMLKQLILRRGFLDGWRGWVAAGSVASATMLKHLFIAARRATADGDAP